ncbi:MAG TPA: GAF domain-containing protein [Candidatus Krumholzibacteria bacterium]|nr:GAF domain-containing protein [Candidatus Krumholzibacteria bacterium]
MQRFATTRERYQEIERRLDALLEGEPDPVANAANTSAVIYGSVPDLNWVGFYFARGAELVLGPFQGRVACVRIPVGRGVCGTAVAERRSIVVDNVHRFEGHIACDAASNAELVVPLLHDGVCLGVLDLDSPHLDRFDDDDREGIERLAAVWMKHTRLADLDRPTS